MADIGNFAPTNYAQQVESPFQAALQGYSGGAAIRNDQLQQQQQQLAMQQQQRQSQVVNALVANKNPTAKDYADATLLVPGMKDQFKQSWDTLNTDQQQNQLSDASQDYAAIVAGQPQMVSAKKNQRADLMEQQAGGPTPQSQALRTQAQIIDAHPEFARSLLGMKLASLPGGDKVIAGVSTMNKDAAEQQELPSKIALSKAQAYKATVDANVANAKAPSEVQKAIADANKAGSDATVAAGTVGANIRKASLENANLSSQITDRSGRLALDTDKVQSEYALKAAELARKPGAIDLPESGLKIVNESVQNAVLARQSVAQFNDLANQIEKADPVSFTADTSEWIKQATGNQDYLTAVRGEITRTLTSGAIRAYKEIAPGTFSDMDIKTAMQGIPSGTSDPKFVASYLRGAAKLQAISAQVEDAKADWTGQVGSLTKAPKDLDVGGITVPKGMAFTEFLNKSIKPAGAASQPPASSSGAGAVKSRLLNKYGNGVNAGQD